MMRRRAQGQRGFVITLELVLIFTILGIGLLVGLVALRNALFIWHQKKKAQTVWVFDSSLNLAGDPAPIVLGPVRDFDEHETPRLFYIDREFAAPPYPANHAPSWEGRNFRAFVGVRSDRFTSRHRIFYQNADCTGAQVCIARAGSVAGDNLAIGSLVNASAGGIGFLYPMQSGTPVGDVPYVPGPSYGIGRDLDDVSGYPGTLYRSTTLACDPTLIQSRWTSQTVGEPCSLFTIPNVVAAAFCPAGSNNLGNQAQWCTTENCQCLVGGVDIGDVQGNCDECACPVGWYRATGNNGNNCCPVGTVFDQQAGECRGAQGELVVAIPVLGPDGVTRTFADLTPPFRVNLPPSPSDFATIDPTGDGEGTGLDGTQTPFDFTPQGFDFESPAPDGEEGPPP